jgi:hydrogenase maturation protease
MTEHRRIFIAGIGYTYLRDFSVGPVLVPELQQLDWPPGVEIDDLGPGGPIAAVHRFREAPPYERVIFFGTVRRDRQPGGVYCYRWDGLLPPPDEIQRCVTEAVTGIISLDNMLIIGGYFAVWPATVIVVEVEPVEEEWGAAFSPLVQTAIPTVIATLRRVALGPVEALPTHPATRAESLLEEREDHVQRVS